MERIIAFMMIITFLVMAILYSDSEPLCDGVATLHFDYRPCEDNFIAGGGR